MSLVIYNSLTRQEEKFQPILSNRVSAYVCGPTVYGSPHLGHAKTYVSFDVIFRYLRYQGSQTFHIENITDIGHLLDSGEDRMIKKAKELGQHPMVVAEHYIREFEHAMSRLNVTPPDLMPRASGHIPEQLELIQKLIDSHHAYEIDGSVYFDTSSLPVYCKLSGRSLENNLSGTRVESRSEKRNPNDFALWKKADSGTQIFWKDDWSGAGFPGWHTECVAMSLKYLGPHFDIHGGGMDLKFPHHDCEIAQNDALHFPFAKYWIHTNLLNIQEQKMSKSLNNFVSLNKVLDQHTPEALRYFLVSAHYRSVLEYHENALQSAKNSQQKLYTSLEKLRTLKQTEGKGDFFQKYHSQFCNAMNHDFATPQALAVLFELNKEINQIFETPTPNPEAIADAETLLTELGGDVLGIFPNQKSDEKESQLLQKAMQMLITFRNEAREQKEYDLSDRIRDELDQAGVKLEDTKNFGTKWSWK